MKDKLGVEIEVGDRVVYSGRKSSACWLAVGTVIEIVSDTVFPFGRVKVLKDGTRSGPRWHTRPDDMVVLFKGGREAREEESQR
jgi:hypothetical protein